MLAVDVEQNNTTMRIAYGPLVFRIRFDLVSPTRWKEFVHNTFTEKPDSICLHDVRINYDGKDTVTFTILNGVNITTTLELNKLMCVSSFNMIQVGPPS